MHNIEAIERRLWSAADQLRGNSEYASNEYFLPKPELTKIERERIKKVAKDLLETLKAEKLRIENWPEKEATRSAVRVTIRDFLYNEATGLPVSFYSDEEVETKTDLIYQHVFMQYRGYGAGMHV